MNEKLFRIATIDQDVGVGTTDAGVIIELSIPRANPFRWIWCFYDCTEFTAVGDQAWIQLLNGGEVAAELPAAIIPSTNTRLGMANYPAGVTALPQANTTGATNVGGGGVLWWNNKQNNAAEFAVHPFKIVAEADSVRLISNKAGNTRALLAVLSTVASP